MNTGSFVHYDNPCATIHWDDENQIVWAEWKKTTPDRESFRAALNAGVELIAQKKAQRWLADCLKMGPVAVDDNKWANEDWILRAIGAGVKSLAFVMPQRVSATISVMSFITSPGGEKVATMQFAEIGEARRWLREQR